MFRSIVLQPGESIDSCDALRRLRAARSTACPDAEQTPEASADENWWVMNRADRVLARCSLWWKCVPRYGDERLGLIGHYAAADPEAAAHLLDRACEELRRRSCTMAVGPMDGSTWRNYRLITERGSEPIFFLEPDNPDDWPVQFLASGFFPLAQYFSTLTEDLSPRADSGRFGAHRAREMGVEIRPIRMEEFERELRRIYGVVCESFRQNFLYTPISETDFLAQYQLLRPYLCPELVLLAEKNSRVVGFAFGVPDDSQLARARAIDTVIVKTLSVRPECAGAGLGGRLVEQVHRAARDLGYRRAIHALMHENNASRRISAASKSRMIRRYTLFAKRLDECD